MNKQSIGTSAIFFALLCGTAWILAPASEAPTDPPANAMQGFSIVDLSHSLRPGIPIYPGGVPYWLENVAPIENGYLLNRFSTGEHIGTHVDAPAHFHRGGNHVDQIPIQNLIGPLVMIDLRNEATTNADLEVTIEHVREWERRHGRVPQGSFVIANTGWYKKWNTPSDYLNQDDKGVMHFPGFSADVSTFLVTDRSINGVGIDTLSTDPGLSKDFPEHRIMLGAQKINIENLTNLEQLPASGAYLVVAPIKLAKGSGAPARVFALLTERTTK